MSQPYVGEIRMFAGNFAPNGWLFCDGQLLPISENDVLFTLIGTTYGGDGQETFALPDLRSRVPLHQGNGFVIGEIGGAEEITLTVSQIPTHTHTLTAVDQPGNLTSPSGNKPAQSFNVVPYINDSTTSSFKAGAVAGAGGSQPHTNLQPYLGMHFIISLFGIFPQMN